MARDGFTETIPEIFSKIEEAKTKKENRPALITYTVAGDNTKKNSFKIGLYITPSVISSFVILAIIIAIVFYLTKDF